MGADVTASLDSYRESLTSPQVVGGVLANVPVYPDIMSMTVGIFTRELVQPAFAAFPPAGLATAAQQVAAAVAALAAAQAAAIQGALG
jgi:hypothetical protein